MSGEALVRIPGATAYQVAKHDHTVNAIANGDLLIAYVSDADDASLLAQVGSVSWPLGRWAASLRFDDYTYAFQLSQLPYDDAQAYYYCVTLARDTPLEQLDLLQAVLASGSAYHDQEHVTAHPAAAAAGAPTGAARAGEAGGARAEPFHAQQARAGTTSQADRLAVGLQRGGQLAAAGVLTAAMWAGVAIQKGAEAAVARMQPAERQREPLSAETQARIARAKSVAAKAAAVSGRAVSGALSMTAQVAGALAQRISATDLGRQVNSRQSAQDIRKVGVAGVEAVEAVYDSLADAARIVLAHTHSAATRVARHKYGPGAAQATDAGMQMTQSVVETGLNVYKLRPTCLIKKAVKGTAKQVALGNGGSRGAASGGPAGNGGSGGASSLAAGQGMHGSTTAGTAAHPLPPVAAAALLAALTAPSRAAGSAANPASAAQQYPGAAFGGPVAAAPASPAAAAPPPPPPGVVDGVVVSGPVPAYPVTVVDYTPSVAVTSNASNGPLGAGPTGRPRLQMLPMPLSPQGSGAADRNGSGSLGGAAAPPHPPMSPQANGGSGTFGSAAAATPLQQPIPMPQQSGMGVPPAGFWAAGVAGPSVGVAESGLPYPAVSDSQYAARYYPAVPRA